jgi:hypothetical protein
MDTNVITNLVFVVGTQYYYDPNSIYVCGSYFFQGFETGLIIYAFGNVLRWFRHGVGSWN